MRPVRAERRFPAPYRTRIFRCVIMWCSPLLGANHSCPKSRTPWPTSPTRKTTIVVTPSRRNTLPSLPDMTSTLRLEIPISVPLGPDGPRPSAAPPGLIDFTCIGFPTPHGVGYPLPPLPGLIVLRNPMCSSEKRFSRNILRNRRAGRGPRTKPQNQSEQPGKVDDGTLLFHLRRAEATVCHPSPTPHSGHP